MLFSNVFYLFYCCETFEAEKNEDSLLTWKCLQIWSNHTQMWAHDFNETRRHPSGFNCRELKVASGHKVVNLHRKQFSAENYGNTHMCITSLMHWHKCSFTRQLYIISLYITREEQMWTISLLWCTSSFVHIGKKVRTACEIYCILTCRSFLASHLNALIDKCI